METLPSIADSSEAAVRAFIARINAHDAHGLVGLCTADHIFIDSLGSRLSGPLEIEQAWIGYFSIFADYLIEVDVLVSRDPFVLASGWASARHRRSNLAWRIPCSWRAVVSDGLIAEWQVFADNKPVYEILEHSA